MCDYNCLILLNYNGADLIEHFIDYFGLEKCIHYQAIIVDNCSTDGSYEKLRTKYGNNLDVIRTNSNLGYAGGNNYGFNYAMQKYHPRNIIICNPDIYVNSSVIEKLLQVLDTENSIKLVGCKILDKDRKEQLYTWKLPGFFICTFSLLFLINKLFIKNERKYTSKYLSDTLSVVDVVSGSLLAADANTFLDIGGFAAETFLYGEENILGKKLKDRGFKSAVLNSETYLHIHSASIDNSLTYYKKFLNVIQGKKIYLFNYLKINRLYKLVFYVVSFVAKLERKCIVLFMKDRKKS